MIDVIILLFLFVCCPGIDDTGDHNERFHVVLVPVLRPSSGEAVCQSAGPCYSPLVVFTFLVVGIRQ